MPLGLTWKKIYNHLLGEYRVKAYLDSASNDYVQVVALESSLGLPTAPTPAEATQTTNSSITTTSSTLLAADSSRLGGYIVAPKSNTQVCYISFNNPATVDDIPIYAGGVFQLTLNFGGAPVTNAVYARSESGTQKLITVVA